METKACYRKLNKYKYQLVKEFKYGTGILEFDIDLPFIKLDTKGNLTILSNYAWDGASGPTIDTINSMRASLVHDALYQLLRMKKLPQELVIIADKLFKKILIIDGMSSFRAGYWYRGLRFANGSAAKPETQEPLESICAP